MKKRFPVFAGLMSAVLALSLFGCGNQPYDKDIWMNKDGYTVPTEAYELPTSANFGDEVSVHDPSVFYDDVTEKYYAFGTHFAVASSPDLISWTQEATDGQYEKLYSKAAYLHNNVNWPQALKPILEVVDPDSSISTTWAPDVMKIGDRYYMYFSITSGFGSNKSAIGRVSASKVLGPYSGAEMIVYSEGTSKDEPNCIDPELFYDAEGKLWMVYGSHYGGIFIKELDKNGLPVVSDRNNENYYGTRVWKGGGTVVEGPFVFYNAETEYYYLMTTYGDLQTNYNMRVARSKTPDGPYTDISNRSLGTTYDVNGGNKLAGNYQFRNGPLKVATGHNSVIKKDGKYLVVSHVRNALKGAHHLEVKQLFFNEDGWPVMSPNRYVGENPGLVTQEQAAGTYDVVVHTAGADVTTVNSVRYTLNADGKIVNGSEQMGTWSVSQNYYVTITLGEITYKGVVAPGWREYSPAGVLCMTLTSTTGNALWLNAAP